MRYDVTDHPLLTDEAKQLGSETLEAQADVAEELLGLLLYPEFAAGSAKYKSAQNAVALQVSYQVECGMDAFISASIARGARGNRFRGATRMPLVHGQARRIVSRIRPKAEAETA